MVPFDDVIMEYNIITCSIDSALTEYSNFKTAVTFSNVQQLVRKSLFACRRSLVLDNFCLAEFNFDETFNFQNNEGITTILVTFWKQNTQIKMIGLRLFAQLHYNKQ